MKWGARQIRWVKRLDAWMGTGLDGLGPPHRLQQDVPSREVKRILFVKFWGLGSIVLTQPALRSLRQAYPHAEIHYLSITDNLPLLQLLPEVDRAHGLRASNWAAMLWDAARITPRLQQHRFDLVFDAECLVAFSAWVCRLSSGGRTIGFKTSHGIRWYQQTVAYDPGQHVARQFLNLVNIASRYQGPSAVTSGDDDCPPRPRLQLPESRSLVMLRPYLVVNVNASPLALERRWPRDRFIALGKALLQEFPLDLVLTGSAGEAAYVHAVEAALNAPGRVRNLSGRLNLWQLAELIADATAVISNDSGPVHLASAFDVPIVAFYGPETPRRYGPLSARRLVLYRDLPCSPCMTVENAKTVNCRHGRQCMTELHPDEVIRQVSQFVADQLDQRLPLIGRGKGS